MKPLGADPGQARNHCISYCSKNGNHPSPVATTRRFSESCPTKNFLAAIFAFLTRRIALPQVKTLLSKCIENQGPSGVDTGASAGDDFKPYASKTFFAVPSQTNYAAQVRSCDTFCINLGVPESGSVAFERIKRSKLCIQPC